MKGLVRTTVALLCGALACQCQPLPTAEQFGYADAGDAKGTASEVVSAGCGNGECDGSETAQGCPADCAGANRHLAQACSAPGTTNGCDPGYVCVARSALGGGAVCVADFATWLPLPLGHPEGSFVATADSCTDQWTGLTWTNAISPPVRDFDANLYCAQVKDGGLRDWRLPTRAELYTLVEFNRNGLMSTAPGLQWNPQSYCHWSASKAADGWGGWVVNLWGGNSMTYGDLYTCVVRCVRGQPDALQLRPQVARYAELGDGTAVLDRQTGLQWRKTPPVGERSSAEAESYCQSLRLQQPGSAWRLPSVVELMELADLRRSQPALAPPLQPAEQGTTLFHTASKVVPDADVWSVDFSSGAVLGNQPPQALQRQTRCVQ